MILRSPKDFRGYVLAFGVFVAVLFWGTRIEGNPPRFVGRCCAPPDPMICLDK